MRNDNTAIDHSKKIPQPRPTRLAIVRKSLLAITGNDATAAMILDKFLHWADRGHRSDGWIWKSSKELANIDLMGIKSARSVQRRLARLVDVGYLERRSNPDDPRDHVPQYRAKVSMIYQAVTQAGYTLEGWTTAPDRHSVETSRQNDGPPRQNDATIPESTNREYKQRTTTAEGSTNRDLEAIDTDPDDSPSQKLLALSQRAGVHLGVMQAETAWKQIHDRLGESAWDYIRYKLADLEGTEYTRRSKFTYLTSQKDIDGWLALQGEQGVGGHNPADGLPTQSTQNPPPKTPESSPEARKKWAEIYESLKTTMTSMEMAAADCVHPVSYDGYVLTLSEEMAGVRDTVGEFIEGEVSTTIEWASDSEEGDR